jgi:hypothetical protein
VTKRWPSAGLRLEIAATCLTLLALSGSPSLASDSVADFYKGKQIKIVVGVEAGSSYDILSRMVGQYMPKYLAGSPTFIVQNMPAAAGRVATNWIYSQAPRDGTTIGTVLNTAPLDQARKQEGVQYDAAKLNWLGTPVSENSLTIAWRDAGYESLDDVAKKGGLICAGLAASSPSVTLPQVINNLAGTKIRIVSGYKGPLEVGLALQRGEANCISGTWGSQTSREPQLIEQKKYSILVQWGVEKNPQLSQYMGRDVPLSAEFVKTDLDRKALAVINTGIGIGRPMVAPPEVPADRLAALRKAFEDTMKIPNSLPTPLSESSSSSRSAARRCKPWQRKSRRPRPRSSSEPMS